MLLTGQKRVLIVDDEHVMAKLVSHVTKSIGFTQVEVAHDAERALERLREESFDLVLSDVRMEPWSGFRLVSTMRKDARLATIPVILMTALRDPEIPMSAKRVGANGFLAKPFRPEALRDQIERVMIKA